MQIKIDENLGERKRKLFAEAGHDFYTVKDQGLEGAVDNQLSTSVALRAAVWLLSTWTSRTRSSSRRISTPGSPSSACPAGSHETICMRRWAP
jgi:hypothetical protein